MPDKPHRSRQGWRDMSADPDDDLVPGMPFHYHRPPKWIARCIIGLLILGVLNLSGLSLSLLYDVRQQQYIEGRGEYRDREAARMKVDSEESLRRAMCDLLDQFPEGGWLERPRMKYDCGPGIPIEALTPEEQERIKATTPPPQRLSESPPELYELPEPPPLPEGAVLPPPGQDPP